MTNLDYHIRVRAQGACVARNLAPKADARLVLGGLAERTHYLGFVTGVDGYRWLDVPYWWDSPSDAAHALNRYLYLRDGKP